MDLSKPLSNSRKRLRFFLCSLVISASFNTVSAQQVEFLLIPEVGVLLFLGSLVVGSFVVAHYAEENKYQLDHAFDTSSNDSSSSSSNHFSVISESGKPTEDLLTDPTKILGDVVLTGADADGNATTNTINVPSWSTSSGTNLPHYDIGVWDPLNSIPNRNHYTVPDRILPYVIAGLHYNNFDSSIDINGSSFSYLQFPYANSTSLLSSQFNLPNHDANQMLKMMDLANLSFWSPHSYLNKFSTRNEANGVVKYTLRGYPNVIVDDIYSNVSIVNSVVGYYAPESTIDIDVNFPDNIQGALSAADAQSVLPCDHTANSGHLACVVQPPPGSHLHLSGSIGIPFSSTFNRSLSQRSLSYQTPETAIKDHFAGLSGYVSGYLIIDGHISLTGDMHGVGGAWDFENQFVTNYGVSNIWAAPRDLVDWFNLAMGDDYAKSGLQYSQHLNNKIVGFVGQIYLDNTQSFFDIPFNTTSGTFKHVVPFSKIGPVIPLITESPSEPVMMSIINSRLNKWLDSWSNLTGISVPWEEPLTNVKPWDVVNAPDSGLDRRTSDNSPVMWVVDPATALKNAFIPHRSISTRYNDLLTQLTQKWPFNIAVQLHTFDSPGSTLIDLPTINLPYGVSIGMPAATIAPMLSIIRSAASAALTWWFTRFLIFKLRPKPQI
jgi:hypothetical protein